MNHNITLTEAATDHITKFIDKNESCVGVKIAIIQYGCSGSAFKIEPIESFDDINSDLIFEINSIKLTVDFEHLDLIKNTKVDYFDDGIQSGIKFENPKIKSACGCGLSYIIEE